MANIIYNRSINIPGTLNNYWLIYAKFDVNNFANFDNNSEVIDFILCEYSAQIREYIQLTDTPLRADKKRANYRFYICNYCLQAPSFTHCGVAIESRLMDGGTGSL